MGAGGSGTSEGLQAVVKEGEIHAAGDENTGDS